MKRKTTVIITQDGNSGMREFAITKTETVTVTHDHQQTFIDFLKKSTDELTINGELYWSRDP